MILNVYEEKNTHLKEQVKLIFVGMVKEKKTPSKIETKYFLVSIFQTLKENILAF